MGRLSEAIEAETNGRRGSVCTVEAIRQKLEPEDLTDFEAAMVSDIPAAAIARALGTVGIDVKQGALQRHRRGECTCVHTR